MERYLEAKETVIAQGFAAEIDWQDGLDFDDVTESNFLQEAAWVILSSGMRETVIRRKFPAVSKAFLHWRSAKEIVAERRTCRCRCLSVFAHEGKADAILQVAEIVGSIGYEAVREKIQRKGVAFLQEFAYLGPATSYHLAKNLGLNVAKPDRHLVRVSQALGYGSAQELCQAIADLTGERIPVVDLVIWRFATLDRDYVAFFQCCGARRTEQSFAVRQ